MFPKTFQKLIGGLVARGASQPDQLAAIQAFHDQFSESGLSAKIVLVPNTSELDLTTVQKLNYAIGQLFLRALAPTLRDPGQNWMDLMTVMNCLLGEIHPYWV